ncbi:MAG TPA: DsrE family protein [Roseomonas sp.]|nr:DsrE family protein [Roseomonas sp.]
MFKRGVLQRALLMLLAGVGIARAQAPAPAAPAAGRKRFLVHVTTGPQDPTKAALAFLVAATALKQGHAVTLFLAGEGVRLLTTDALASVEGQGTGRLSAHLAEILANGGRFALSGMSARARGLGQEILAGRPAEFAQPDALVRLASEADVVITY